MVTLGSNSRGYEGLWRAKIAVSGSFFSLRKEGTGSCLGKPQCVRGPLTRVSVVRRIRKRGIEARAQPFTHGPFTGRPQDAIRQRAYLKWLAAGMPAGDGINFWLEAEKEILPRDKRSGKAPFAERNLMDSLR